MKEEIIKAVHDKDLEKLMNKIGLLGQFQQGLLKCGFCNRVVTFDNLQGIYKEGKEIRMICDNPICYKKFVEKHP